MRVTLDWLKEYININESPEDIARRLTDAGLEATVENDGGQLPDTVVIGHVLSVEKHPDADRLSVCKVDVGDSEPLQIVCGAPNVSGGQKVPVALVGTQLAPDFAIKKVQIRGIESSGMICAEDELGLSENHSGIMVLEDTYMPGKSFNEYLNPVTVFEIELTPNRSDCFSHWGVVREIAAIYNKEYEFHPVLLKESDTQIENFANVTISDVKGCPRYTARVIRNVKVASSPEWLKRRIEAVGLRSINNVVDASNYVLMETGHPLHTFDYDKLAGHKIDVRFARKNEKFITLDHKERTLSENVLLICDGEKPVAMAGIMGGLESEVTDATVNILIESAYFEPSFIRKGSKEQQLSSDASKRFERGMDPNATLVYAQNRLAELILEVAGGELAKGMIDIYPEVIPIKTVHFHYNYYEKVTGSQVDQKTAVQIFTKLGFQLIESNTESVIVEIPTFRPDLEREIDLVEEVVRIRGFESVPDPTHVQMAMSDKINRFYEKLTKVRNFWIGKGFHESLSNSLVSKEMAEAGIWKRPALALENPLSAEMAYLRTDILQSLVNNLKMNAVRKRENISLFEIGTAISSDESLETGALEKLNCAVLLCSQIWDSHWAEPEKSADIFYLKGLLHTFLLNQSLPIPYFVEMKDTRFSHLYSININNELIGYLGEYAAVTFEKYQLEHPVVALELNLDVLFAYAVKKTRYSAVSPFPGMVRDISVVVNQATPVGEIIQSINKNGGDYLQEVKTYDLYRDLKKLDQNKQAVSFRLYFRSLERTLTDNDIDPVMEKLFKTLYHKHGAQLR